MSEVEHPVAVYVDGMVAIPIKQKDIVYEQKWKDEKDWDLTRRAQQMSAAGNLFTPDLENRLEFRSAAENGSREPCFALVDKKGGRTPNVQNEYPIERDKRHDVRVRQLCALLNRRGVWDIAFGKKNEILLELNGYFWSVETTRIYSTRGIIRHDIVGQQVGNRLLGTSPVVAIEVINHNWPSQPALDDMLSESKKSTLFVMFDLLNKYNTALQIFPNKGVIKPAIYVDGGFVCRGGKDAVMLKHGGSGHVLTPDDLRAQTEAAIDGMEVWKNDALDKILASKV